MSVLPSISDLANAAKRQKGELSVLRSAYESVTGYDIGILAEEKFSPQQKEWLLLSKFGVSSVNKVCRAVRAIPAVLTASQKTSLLVQLTGPGVKSDTAKQIADCIQCYCPHLIDDDIESDRLLLAPPTEICYDCSRKLVSQHETQVRYIATLIKLMKFDTSNLVFYFTRLTAFPPPAIQFPLTQI